MAEELADAIVMASQKMHNDERSISIHQIASIYYSTSSGAAVYDIRGIAPALQSKTPHRSFEDAFNHLVKLGFRMIDEPEKATRIMGCYERSGGLGKSYSKFPMVVLQYPG